MSSIFVSRSPAPQTKEQKKISSLVLKPSTAAKKRMLPGPVTVLYKKPETEVKE
jgi:hypothetical protein